jgi:DNA ligase (NAD+)
MINSITRLFGSVFGDQAGGGKVFHPRLKCPECRSKLWAEAGAAEPVWLCPNPDCPAEVRARIAHWCSPGAMNIANGEVLAAPLVKCGLVRDVAELYLLKRGQLARVKGLDGPSAENFLAAVAASKQRELWRVLYALRIEHVCKDAAKSLARRFPTMLHLLDASLDRLRETEGVSEATARSIVHWYGDRVNRNLIKRLEKAGVNFRQEN